jgi:hypothetical protein
MAEYKGIKGFKVQYLDQDPVPAVAGWSAGGNFPGSNEGMGSTGTQTATLSAGYFNAGDGVTSSFTYDGTSWSPAPSMGTAREQVSNNMAGTQTSAVIACGRNATAFGLQATEEYNGSTWSPSGNYPTQLRDANLFGIQTAAIAAGGNSANPGVATNVNNSYDGSTWTATGNDNTTARLSSLSFGTQTAGILVGGYINSPTPNTYYNNVEEYDGSTWTSGGAYPVGTYSLRGGGTQTAGIAFGGSSPGIPQTTATNIYDGATWTAGSNMTTARSSFGSAKSGSSALNLAFAGNTGPAATNATEEYVDYSPYAGQTVENVGQVWYNGTTKALKFTDETFTDSWATGTALTNARTNFNGESIGTQTAGLAAAGEPPSPPPGGSTSTEEYNGSTWTTGGNVGTGRAYLGGGGTQTAGLIFAGNIPSTSNATEEYDGASWTAGGTMNTARDELAGNGTQTAGLALGGQTSPGNPTAVTEEYNGTSWANSNNLNVATKRMGTAGIQTAALSFGGANPAYTAATEAYDGTSWTVVGSMNTARGFPAGAGTQSAALAFGGGPPVVGATELYDGTTWTNSPASLNTARRGLTGGGSQAAAFGAGGETATATVANTEEFTITGTKNIKTVTVS